MKPKKLTKLSGGLIFSKKWKLKKIHILIFFSIFRFILNMKLIKIIFFAYFGFCQSQKLRHIMSHAIRLKTGKSAKTLEKWIWKIVWIPLAIKESIENIFFWNFLSIEISQWPKKKNFFLWNFYLKWWFQMGTIKVKNLEKN